MRDDKGTVSGYGIPVDERFAERLTEVWSLPDETWTFLEFSGTSARPMAAAACAVRTDAPRKSAPVAGLVGQPGVQRPLLNAMNPRAVVRLGIAAVPTPAAQLERLLWRVQPTNPALLEQTRL